MWVLFWKNRIEMIAERKERREKKKTECCWKLAASVINDYVLDVIEKSDACTCMQRQVYWCFSFCICQCFPFPEIRIRCFVWTQIKGIAQDISVLWVLISGVVLFSMISCLFFCLQNNSLQLLVGICIMEFTPVRPIVLKLFMTSHLLHETLACLIVKSANFSPICSFLPLLTF